METTPRKPIASAALIGAFGALVLWLIQLLMQSSSGQPPLGSIISTKFLGMSGTTATLIGLLLFLGAGAVWGAIYAAVTPKISWLTGLIFDILP